MRSRLMIACLLGGLFGCSHLPQQGEVIVDNAPTRSMCREVVQDGSGAPRLRMPPAEAAAGSGDEIIEGPESGPEIQRVVGGRARCRQGACDDQDCGNKPCAPPKTKVIRVKVPPQKVVVESPPKQNLGAQPNQFNAPQEVLLVPRTVFMPYVAQTPTGPARVLSLQGAVPLSMPPPQQPLGAPPQQPLGAPPPEKPKPCEPAPPCRIEIPDTCCPADVEALNRRLDRLENLLQQLCTPCPPVRK